MKTSNPVIAPINGINITPLVDVCLVLVIIFMVAAPLMMKPILPVDLPKAHTSEGKDTDNITITITKDHRWALNEEEMEPSAIQPLLIEKVEASRDRYVIIRADRDVKHAYVLKALRMARRAGAWDYAIATEQKTRERKK